MTFSILVGAGASWAKAAAGRQNNIADSRCRTAVRRIPRTVPGNGVVCGRTGDCRQALLRIIICSVIVWWRPAAGSGRRGVGLGRQAARKDGVVMMARSGVASVAAIRGGGVP